MGVTECDTTSVCCLRPLYGASCSSLGTLCPWGVI